MTKIFAFIAVLLAPLAAFAESIEDIVQVDVLSGWRAPDGTHMAGLRLKLAPGWKTYWRSPGDAGIPPSFSWRGSRNIDSVRFHWPIPEVQNQNGFRTLGYSNQVVIPVQLMPKNNRSIRMNGRIELGVCKDVCIPVSLDFKANLPTDGARDPQITAALIDQPLSATEAGVQGVSCDIEPTSDGLRMAAHVDMPQLGRDEIAVVELPDQSVWVSETKTVRSGDRLTATMEMANEHGKPFALDRSRIRITVLSQGAAVDIMGCSAG
ncbi:protein-disulfide reductase DsbD domain-containing protein [Parasulfitobacter algicola]|uniref:Thiol:disulfide interchange protein DsbD N-terminal domain-containing protein n=1 Tax=Parasulfitobacter algicola TaxID=2614809 RepID=A0ABX2IV95_9RHOB|nr:protein-disulfide reductase DsbD domain-containing protein [Sulfitobacter algicola]NSX54294.1 hypothetical protein [Sulfitobacter algicola]